MYFRFHKLVEREWNVIENALKCFNNNKLSSSKEKVFQSMTFGSARKIFNLHIHS